MQLNFHKPLLYQYFISTAKQRWIQYTKLNLSLGLRSLGSVLGLDKSPLSKADSSKCYITNIDFYSLITCYHSHLPFLHIVSSMSLSLTSLFFFAGSAKQVCSLS